MSNNPQRVSVLLEYEAATDMAIGFSGIDGTHVMWIPRSQIQNLDDLSLERNNAENVIIPYWLADKKGLLDDAEQIEEEAYDRSR